MSLPTKTCLNSILLGDELGQIKLVHLSQKRNIGSQEGLRGFESHDNLPITEDATSLVSSRPNNNFNTLDASGAPALRPKIIRVIDKCIQKQPAASRAIVSIRPIGKIYESSLDTTDKSNSLFLLTNRMGQIFVCDTGAIINRLSKSVAHSHRSVELDDDNEQEEQISDSPVLSPVYYNLDSRKPVCGAQPLNQTSILVVYQNGDIQQVDIGQDILQSSLKIKRKAICMLGLGYNSDARATHWKIDGSSGVCQLDSEATTTQMDDNDPLTDLVLGSPQKSPKKRPIKHQDMFNESPCVQSRRLNEGGRLVPAQVINMLTSRAEQYKSGQRACKWNSITSLNLIYKKLALYDLVASDDPRRSAQQPEFRVDSFKLSADRLAVAGRKYAVRVYDLQTQKPIFNCLTGTKNPLRCPTHGDPVAVGDLDWLGGNKTTKKQPGMIATCSAIDSIVKVYDLRSPKPAFFIDLTHETESKWQPYENHPRGCVFTSICASGAPYSTAVPSQQLVLGSTNGQMYVLDLRFVAKTYRTMGRLSGFCGGSTREIRFVSETFETSKIISCASDRFVRVHKLNTSFTSVVSERLDAKVFLGTKPTCLQAVCEEARYK